MSRKLKRVALDFTWPLDKVWGGYLNPFYSQSVECNHCHGCGESAVIRELRMQWYGRAPFDPVAYGSEPFLPTYPAIAAMARRNSRGMIGAELTEAKRLADHFNKGWQYHLNQQDVDALIAADRLWDLTKTFTEEGWVPTGNVPTAREVNEWAIGSLGHDDLNMMVCVRARADRDGITQRTCEARCQDGRLWPPGVKQLADAWTESEPPPGDGFQAWETVSEGSPISPVFATLDELCAYCARELDIVSDKLSAAAWREILTGEALHKKVLDNGTTMFIV